MQMANVGEWRAAEWDAAEDGANGFSLGRGSDTVCGRCGQPGPWTLRLLPNGELAHRDYAVCRCGELLHVEAVWPDAPMPFRRR